MDYKVGDIIQPCDYVDNTNAWVGRNGNMYYVEPCGHAELAMRWGYYDTLNCEIAGYIHISCGNFVNYDLPSPTKSQVDTILMWCAARGKPVPQWAMLEHEHAAPVTPMSNTYMYKLNRKQRDIFYPNSGD